jgi:sugar phosphate isomerase/epimerase
MNELKKTDRRSFTRTLAVTGVGALTLPLTGNSADVSEGAETKKRNLKISLNAYSFDKPLKNGTLSMEKMLDYCSDTGFDGVDLTGYYFPGYPLPPSDEFIFHIKKKAFRLGLGISGTGVRNDFTLSDKGRRGEEKKLVKDWIIVASKLGAPLVRIFAGPLSADTFTRDERLKWIADDINECARFGKEHGVMLALQNHNDFLKNSGDVEIIMNLVDKEWVGLLLDIGSYHTADPYKDIALNAKHAISWQLKEKIFFHEDQVDTDYRKVLDIIKQCGYSGYLPLETLGEGEPAPKVEALYNKVMKVMQD